MHRNIVVGLLSTDVELLNLHGLVVQWTARRQIVGGSSIGLREAVVALSAYPDRLHFGSNMLPRQAGVNWPWPLIDFTKYWNVFCVKFRPALQAILLSHLLIFLMVLVPYLS